MQGFGAKLGYAIGNYFESMSPTLGKHTMGAMGYPRGTTSSGGFINATQAGTDYLNKVRGAWGAMKSDFGAGEITKNYFKGGNLEDLMHSRASEATGAVLQGVGIMPTQGFGSRTASEVMFSRGVTRTATAAGAGVLALGSMFGGGDSTLGSMVGFGAKTAAHGGIGYGARALGHPKIGMGYWALSGVNMLRGGDNFGPF